MGRKLISMFTLVFAFVALSTFVIAQETPTKDGNTVEKQEKRQKFGRSGKRGKRGKRGMRRGGDRELRGLMRSLGQLDLDENQKSQIKTMMQTHRSSTQPQREELRSIYMKHREGTITEEDKNRAKEIRTEMKANSSQLKNSILALLTAEQTQKLEQIKAERKRRMEERRQRWQERRQKRSEEPATKTEDS